MRQESAIFGHQLYHLLPVDGLMSYCNALTQVGSAKNRKEQNVLIL